MYNVIDHIILFSSKEPWFHFQDKLTFHVIITASWIVLVFSLRFLKCWALGTSSLLFAVLETKSRASYELARCCTPTVHQSSKIVLAFSFPVRYSTIFFERVKIVLVSRNKLFVFPSYFNILEEFVNYKHFCISRPLLPERLVQMWVLLALSTAGFPILSL